MVTSICVTGAGGFIGTNLLARLAEQDDAIYAVDVVFRYEKLPGVTYIESSYGDLMWLDAVPKFDVVIHLAAVGNVRNSLADPIAVFERDVVELTRFLENLRANDMVPRTFIFTSTAGAMFGSGSGRIFDESIPDPQSQYAIFKYVNEEIILKYANAFDFSARVFRLSNVYGPFSDHKVNFINKFIEYLLEIYRQI